MEPVKPGITIVIPSYNSGGLLEQTCRKTADVLSRSFDWEIIIVNDCSTDSTWEVIKKLHGEERRIKGISLGVNSGQQEAVFCGLMFSSNDWTVTMDDDLEHNPEIIPDLYEKALVSYDLVYVNSPRTGSILRRAGSFVHDILFYLLFKKPLGIKITSYRIMSKLLVSKIIMSDRKFIYVSAEALLSGPAAGVLKTEKGITPAGGSRYNLKKLAALLCNLSISYTLSRRGRAAPGSGGKRGEITEKITELLL